MQMRQGDYEERKARADAGAADGDDLRLVKLYEREGFTCRGSSTAKSSETTPPTSENSESAPPSSAPHTAPHSTAGKTEPSTVRSAGKSSTSVGVKSGK